MSEAVERLQSLILEVLGAQLGLSAGELDAGERFSRHGLDSLGAMALVKRLAISLDRALSPVVVWRYPTPHQLARHLAGEGDDEGEQGAARGTRGIGGGVSRADASERIAGGLAPDEPIAIIGMSCRFPGAPDLESFWRLLEEGRSAIGEVPRSRWSAERWLDAEPRTSSRGGSRWGGFLDQIDELDPLFFGISPREAIAMDPQQRLLLELAWEALEDASVLPERLRGSQTGVYVGAAWVDYARLLYQQGPSAITQHTVTGHHRSILANRLSYVLGLHGPSLSVDSACSSALVAVHLACEGLLRGDVEVALAGAVNLNLLPESTHAMVKFGALSPDGKCHTFDARANGYVRGEGAAMLVLKRLSRALVDGDPIRCVIRGSAVNNDGASNGLTAPNPVAQEALLRTAYQRAAISPAEVQYVELHGTGTQLGDPIEASALGAAVGAAHREGEPLIVGSVKTNLGHLEGAAGLAGLCKAALCIERRRLVPSLHFEAANPHIPLDELHLRVQTEAGPWPRMERPLVAGVSSFGMGGTNAHVVLAEWPSPPVTIYPLAAPSEEALRAQIEERRVALVADRGGASPSWPAPVVGSHRLAIAARSPAELLLGLEEALVGKTSPRLAMGMSAAPPSIVFVYAGQGAQWHGMGRSLLHREPVMRAALGRCARLIEARLGWSLLDELLADKARSRLDHVEVGWPASIAIQIALTELWRSWGVAPAAVIGHSGGEIAAAYAAGSLGLEDAIATICAYARHLAQVRGQGAMGLIGLGWDDARAALEAQRHAAADRGRLYLAIHHGADATVIAGDPAALTDWFEALDERGVFCRQLPVDVAPHSPLVAHLRESLRAELEQAGIAAHPAQVPLASAALGQLLPGERFDVAHWVRNFCEPLAFSPAIDELIGLGHRVFLEVSTHPSTLYAIIANLRRAGVAGTTLPSLRRDEDERGVLLDSLGALYALGAGVRWPDVLAAAVERGDGTLEESPASLPLPLSIPLSIPLSGRSDAALADGARRLVERLESDPRLLLADVARTLALGRTAFEQRAIVVAQGRAELLDGLRALSEGIPVPQLVRGEARPAGKLVFIFPGQGSQWPEMARALLGSSPVFKARLEACAAALAPHVDWSLLKVLRSDDGAALLERVDVLQPVLFSVMVALAAEWQARGVLPDAVLGHSQGEIAAACVAGALSLEDAALVVARRSRALRALAGRGGMALVELPAAEVEPRLDGHGGALAIAAINGPRSTVVSGERTALQALLAELEREGVFARAVRVDYASHSPQVDELRGELDQLLAEVRPRRAAVPFLSTVDVAWLGGEELSADYWHRNLRQPVRLAEAAARLISEGHTTFLEVSPHPVLTVPLRDALTTCERDGVVAGSLRRGAGDVRQLELSAAALFVAGVALDWRRLLPVGPRASLPTYAFQRERYWIEPASTATPVTTSSSLALESDAVRAPKSTRLFGAWLSSSLHPGVWLCEGELSVARLPYLAEHRVEDRVVVPGAAYPALLLEALTGSRWDSLAAQPRFGEVVLHAALELGEVPGEDARRSVQLVLSKEEGGYRFHVSSRRDVRFADIAHGDAGDDGWLLHASGELLEPSAAASPEERKLDVEGRKARCPRRISGAEHQAIMRSWGLDYAGGFTGLSELWLGRDELLAAVRAPSPAATRTETSSKGSLDPRWLDSAWQAALAFDPRYVAALSAGAVMPIRFSSLHVYALPAPETITWCVARRAAGAGADRQAELQADLQIDLLLHAADGAPLVEVLGLTLRRLTSAKTSRGQRALRRQWKRIDRAQAPAAATRDPGRWLLVGEGEPLAALATSLRERGADVAMVDARQLATSEPAPAAQLVRDGLGAERCRGVVHLASLSCPSHDADDRSMVAAAEPVWASALHLVQALLAQGLRDTPRLWLLSRGDGYGALLGALLFGFGRTLAYEHPELQCTRLDLRRARDTSAADAGAIPAAERDADSLRWAALADELLADPAEDELSLRGDHRFVAQLATSPLDRRATSAPLVRGDASYLITGGLGGLGLSVARWLVGAGARRLVLAGRAAAAPPPGSPAAATLAELHATGAEVLLAAADASSAADVARIVRLADTPSAPLRGVFHLAGVLDDGLIAQQDAARYRRVLAPKVDGAWHLHRHTERLALDHFVLYSSVAALIGSPGQTSYAAANSFLDALAEHRRHRGLPALSIAWGPFSEVGLAAAREVRGERLQDRGMKSMSPLEGQLALAALLDSDEVWGGAVKLDVARWLDFYPALAGSSYFAALLAESSAASGTSQPVAERASEARALRDKLRATPPALRLPQLEAVVRQQLARVLQCRPEVITAQALFTSLGLESLTGLELRNRLEAETGLRLPATILWTRGNVAGMARELLDRMFAAEPLSLLEPERSSEREPATAPDLEPALDGALLSSLSEDDLLAELTAALDEVDADATTSAPSAAAASVASPPRIP